MHNNEKLYRKDILDGGSNMDWQKVGENALAVGVLAVGGIIALANQSKLQDLG